MDAVGTLQADCVWPDTTVGTLGLRAVVYPLPGVRNLGAEDPETAMPVFTPHHGTVNGEPKGERVIVARMLAGQDLGAAARQLCAEHG